MNATTRKLVRAIKERIDALAALPIMQRWESTSELEDYAADAFHRADHALIRHERKLARELERKLKRARKIPSRARAPQRTLKARRRMPPALAVETLSRFAPRRTQ